LIEFLGFDGVTYPNPGPPDFFFKSFQPPITLSAHSDVVASERIRDHFAPRIWRPEFAVGDAMLLTTWTLHATHVTPKMTQLRENAELRYYGSASLADILAAQGVAVRALAD
jgi:hypothetical protein